MSSIRIKIAFTLAAVGLMASQLALTSTPAEAKDGLRIKLPAPKVPLPKLPTNVIVGHGSGNCIGNCPGRR